MYFTNTDPKKPHMTFIGRWCPLHIGHTWIVEQKIDEERKPVLILVRDTDFDEFSAEQRAELVRQWMLTNHIEGSIMIIPDISGVHYGRGVGYDIEELIPPENIKSISATKIRELIAAGDDSWRDIVARGTDGYLEEIIGQKA